MWVGSYLSNCNISYNGQNYVAIIILILMLVNDEKQKKQRSMALKFIVVSGHLKLTFDLLFHPRFQQHHEL